jgi:hypothetical protein
MRTDLPTFPARVSQDVLLVETTADQMPNEEVRWS